jgi:hypothetical protein
MPGELDPPSDGIVLERMRTEATLWINAVHLQRARIDRRHDKQDHESHEVTALEVDLHFFLIALMRLRRFVERVGVTIDELRAPLQRRLADFDDLIPALQTLRNVSEHIDEYNLDQGRDNTVSRRQVQTWYIDSNESGNPVWGWLGHRLDVDASHRAARDLYRGFMADGDAWIAAHPASA